MSCKNLKNKILKISKNFKMISIRSLIKKLYNNSKKKIKMKIKKIQMKKNSLCQKNNKYNNLNKN